MNNALNTLLDDSALRYGALMALIETGADMSLKAYAQTDDPKYIAGGTAGYGAVVYIFQRALRNDKLGRVNAFWNSFTTVSDVVAGMYMGETYTQTQLLGFGLISIGIFLI